MNRDETLLLRAVGDVLAERLRTVTSRLAAAEAQFTAFASRPPLPPPPVINEVSPAPVPVEVRVDLAPLAEAMREMTAAITEVIGGLVRIISERALVEFNPTIRVPETKVEAPQVTVQAPQRPKRTLVITHDDGTKSVVREE